MNYRKVVLTDGREIKVYPPPTIQIEAALTKRFPMPEVPIVKETTKAGKEVAVSIDDDPEYRRKMEEAEQLRQQAREEYHYLFALKDEIPPDDFDIELVLGEEIHYMNPNWKPREGKIGRKVDWIEWVIMGDMVNATRIGRAMKELISVDLEVVSQVEESFRDKA